MTESQLPGSQRSDKSHPSTGIAVATHSVLQSLENLESRRKHSGSVPLAGRYAAAKKDLAEIGSPGPAVRETDGTEVGQNMKMLAARPFVGS